MRPFNEFCIFFMKVNLTVSGAIKIGSYWAIPADAEKPKDERIKSGRYIKTVRNPYKED